MIVLDEHLQGIGLEASIRHWYGGHVCPITDLRPGTVIKDEAIPGLLRSASQPTFVTLNWSDFWQRVQPDAEFCLVFLTLGASHAANVSPLLRRLFRLSEFRTKACRLGKVVRISGLQVSYFEKGRTEIRLLNLPE